VVLFALPTNMAQGEAAHTHAGGRTACTLCFDRHTHSRACAGICIVMALLLGITTPLNSIQVRGCVGGWVVGDLCRRSPAVRAAFHHPRLPPSPTRPQVLTVNLVTSVTLGIVIALGEW
jgi:hypothetical protein